MAKGKGGKPAPVVTKRSGDDRQNGKARKQKPKVFDPIKRRLVTKEQ